MGGDLRRNSSSDVINTVRLFIPTTVMVLHKVPMINACLTNIWERRKIHKYLRKSCYHRIKCTASTFLATFMWRKPLNSAIWAITTQRKLKKVSDETSTQVIAQMINKYKMKMIQDELYKGRYLP